MPMRTLMSRQRQKYPRLISTRGRGVLPASLDVDLRERIAALRDGRDCCLRLARLLNNTEMAELVGYYEQRATGLVKGGQHEQRTQPGSYGIRHSGRLAPAGRNAGRGSRHLQTRLLGCVIVTAGQTTLYGGVTLAVEYFKMQSAGGNSREPNLGGSSAGI